MLDGSLTFVNPNGAPVSVVGAAGASIVFPGVIDIAGVGVGAAEPNIIGTATFFGEDVGIGIWKTDIQINIGTAFTTSNSATGEFCLQGAPDTSPSGTPGTWEDFATTGAKTAAQLIASTPEKVFRMAMPPTPPDMPTPRFLRLIMRVPSGTNFTAGTVTAAFVVQGRDDLQNKFQSNNYVVA